MYKAYLASGKSTVSYFILLVLLGKIIMLNLFLSIMLGNFEMSSNIIKGKMEDMILTQFEQNKEHMQQEEDLAYERLKDNRSAASLSSPTTPKTPGPMYSALEGYNILNV